MYCTLHICLQISAPRIYKLRHRVQHYLNDPMQTNAITDRIKTLCKRIEIWNEIKLVMEKRYNKCCRKKIYIYFFFTFCSSQLALPISDVFLSHICFLLPKSWLEHDRVRDGDLNSKLFARKYSTCGQ